MGCDIHGWVEVKVGDKWVAVDRLKDVDRNYKRFALLAGVRDCHKESVATPKGIPNDVSDSARYDIDQWGADGHSHSYMPLADAAKIFLETDPTPSNHEKKYPLDAFFDFEEEDDLNISNVRLVFWFDN